MNNKGIKGIVAPKYKFYGEEPGAEQVGVAAPVPAAT